MFVFLSPPLARHQLFLSNKIQPSIDDKINIERTKKNNRITVIILLLSGYSHLGILTLWIRTTATTTTTMESGLTRSTTTTIKFKFFFSRTEK